MDITTDFEAIRVPVHWAGRTRVVDGQSVWTCGACPTPSACKDAGVCQRAAADPSVWDAERRLYGIKLDA